MTQITAADLDNAKLDVNTIADIANSTGISVVDRLGATRLTANEAIRQMGYQVPVTYATSLVMSTLTQTVNYLGVVYAPLPTMIPFTTSGTFETTKFYVIQNNEIVKKYNTYADILASGGAILDNTRADTSGYHAAGDGGENSFYWDSTSTETHNGGTIIKPSSVSGAGRWLALDNTRVSLAQFGAIAGIDSTDVIIACFTHANSLIRDGLVSTIKNAGCTVIIEPVVYSLDIISTPINILCNVENLGGDFVVPLAYAGTVLVVGHTTSGTNLADAHIELPVVRKPTSSNPLIAGSIGVQLRNINASRIYLSRINYFETALKCGGLGEGTVYNDIFLSQLAYGKVLISLSPGSAGWCNSNRFFGGNLSQSSGFAGGTRLSGYKHLLVDGRSPATSVVGNSFYGTSFEGDVSEFTFDFNFAYKNTFYGCYHETGRATAAVTVSGDTITRVAHGFVVGDKLTFQASAAPTGMFLAAAYYVVSVPTSDTFKVSLNKGGSAVTFSSTGTSVTCLLASVFRFNQTGAEICVDNKLVNLLLTSSSDINVLQTGQAINNGIDPQNGDIKAAYSEQDAPVFRGQNTASTAANKPIFAAYSNSNNPDTSVNLWGAALSSNGVLYQSSGVYVGALKNNGGSMTYQRAGEAAFEIASCTRSPTLLAVTALSCTAGAQTSTTLTLTGAAVSDHLTFTPSSLPIGIIIASAIITSANTITVSFYNYTGGAISLTANFQAMATRRYY